MHTQTRLLQSPSLRFTLWAVGLFGFSPLPAQPADREIPALRAELAAIEARLESLELPSPPLSSGPVAGVSLQVDRRGLVAESADKTFEIRVRPRVQIVANLFPDEENGNSGFTLRRVRPVFEGKAGPLSWRFSPEFAGTVRIIDAWAQLSVRENFSLQAGKFKGPVGYERLQSFTHTLFIERGLPSVLTPSREIGLQLNGSAGDGLIEWTLGAYNGTLDDTDQSNNANLHGNDLDYGVRLSTTPFRSQKSALAGLTVGVAATIGKENTTIADADRDQRIRYRTSGRGTFFRYTEGVVIDGERERLNAFLSWYRGPFGLLAEYLRSSYDLTRETNRQTVGTDAFTIQLGWVLTGENASYGAVRPKRPFDPANGHWGSLEIAVRYGVLEVGDEAFRGDLSTRLAHANAIQRAESVGIGLNGNLTENLRFSLNYEETHFSGLGPDRDTEKAVISSFIVHF